MQVKVEFTGGRGFKVCPMPTGKLVVTRVPGQGLQGYHRPNTGRTQVFVPTGKFRTMAETQAALYAEWRKFVGLDEIRSFG